MYSIYLDVYIAFISIVFLFLLALGIRPKEKENYKEDKNYKPKVLVVMPCKGRDIDLVANIEAAKSQNYKNYKLIAVIESVKDPAFKAIKKSGIEYMIADIKCKECSGKVRNLASAFKRYNNYEVYVLLDSDVLVNEHWLERLVAPLSNKKTGISTAFPVFKPIGGFWSHVKHSWGYVGFGLMENEKTRFGWGGSLAFKKLLIRQKKYFDYFKDSVSDDIALTNINKRLGLKISYVPEANPIVYSNDDFIKFTEWSTRQTAFSIAGNKKLFYFGVIFYFSNVLLLLSGILLAIFVNWVFLLLLIPFAIGLIRTYKRSHSLEVLAIYPIIHFVYLFNLLKANSISTVKWRGRVYSTKTIDKPK